MKGARDVTPGDIGLLAAASVLCLALGSLHAFSLLITGLEQTTAQDRAAISAVYSAATFAVMLGVIVAPSVWRWLGCWSLAFAGCAAAAVLAGINSESYAIVLAGFGIGFGFANGIGYAASLKAAAMALPGQRGLAVGIVTAAYCGGAIALAPLLEAASEPDAQLRLLGLACATAAVICAIAAGFSRAVPESEGGEQAAVSLRRALAHDGVARAAAAIWAVYLAGVAAGLMVLGHSAEIIRWTGGDGGEVTAGAMVISAGSLAGSLAAGVASLRLPSARIALASLALTAAAVALLAMRPPPTGALVLVGLCGIAYGAIITAIPNLVADRFDAPVAFRLFTLVFTAWGIGGLAGPLAAGVAYAAVGSYAPGLAAAAVLALAGAALLRWTGRTHLA